MNNTMITTIHNTTLTPTTTTSFPYPNFLRYCHARSTCPPLQPLCPRRSQLSRCWGDRVTLSFPWDSTDSLKDTLALKLKFNSTCSSSFSTCSFLTHISFFSSTCLLYLWLTYLVRQQGWRRPKRRRTNLGLSHRWFVLAIHAWSARQTAWGCGPSRAAAVSGTSASTIGYKR